MSLASEHHERSECAEGYEGARRGLGGAFQALSQNRGQSNKEEKGKEKQKDKMSPHGNPSPNFIPVLTPPVYLLVSSGASTNCEETTTS